MPSNETLFLSVVWGWLAVIVISIVCVLVTGGAQWATALVIASPAALLIFMGWMFAWFGR